MSKLETTHIFLDTSIYIAHNFNFFGWHFNKLIDLIDSGMTLHTTYITTMEIKSNIDEITNDAISKIDSLRKKARVLRQIREYASLFDDWAKNEINDSIHRNFKNFFGRANANTIDINTVVSESVFDQYFNKSAPFGTGQKKSEFPDAFVIASLENWCKSNNHKMYVISSDQDFKKAVENSENLLFLDKLEMLFNLSIDDLFHECVMKTLHENKRYLEVAVQECFKQCDFFVSDVEGDVIDVHVNRMEIEVEPDFDPLIIEATKNKATVEILVDADFDVYINYADYGNSPYDNESKEYLFIKYEDATINYDDYLNFQVELEYDIYNPHYIKVLKVSNDGYSFELTVFYHY